MSKPTPNEEPIPSRQSADKLSAWLQIPLTTIRGILAPLGIAAKDGYDTREAVKAMVNHYRTVSEKSSRVTQDARARQQEADAARSELALAQELGRLIDRDEARRLFEQVIVSYREEVRNLGGLTLEQKKAVLEKLAKLVLPAKEEQP